MNNMGTAIQDKKNQVGDIVSEVKNKASSYVNEASANIDQTIANARDLLDEGTQGVTDFYNVSLKTLEKSVKKRPVFSLACAFGAGVATIALARSFMSSGPADKR